MPSIEQMKEYTLLELQSLDQTSVFTAAIEDTDFARRGNKSDQIAQLAELMTEERTKTMGVFDQQMLERNGLKIDSTNPKAFRDIVKMGLRVDEVQSVDDKHAWVLMVGRNLDGSEYRYAQYFVSVDEKWVTREIPEPEDLTSLPENWPPPLYEWEVFVEQTQKQIVATIKAGVDMVLEDAKENEEPQ